jgi:paraquat-inducible protein A
VTLLRPLAIESALLPNESMYAEHKECLACHDCGNLQMLPENPAAHEVRQQVECEHCHSVLHISRPQWLDHATAYTLTAAILFVVSVSFPFLALKTAGLHQEASIVSGIVALVDREQWLMAALVFITIFLMPLLEIAALLYLLLPYRLQKRLPGQIAVFRWLIVVQPWSMLEIFAVAVLVTLVKLGEEATLVPGVAMYAFFLLVGALIGAYVAIDRRHIWAWLNRNNYFVSEPGESVYSCNVCQALVGRSIIEQEGRCPRCRSPIHQRIPHSLQKTAALVLAAAILYVPANTLPMMSYTAFGVTQTDTIFSGVAALISDGMWGVALVVFVASIVVPIAKLVVLTYLTWLVKAGRTRNARQQHRLFRTLELIGRWSMVDVFVVTLLVALVQFGLFGQVEPRGAIVAFGGVVVLTMLATQTFDVRLLKDSGDTEGNESPSRSAVHKIVDS